jgi:hypothetical protein
VAVNMKINPVRLFPILQSLLCGRYQRFGVDCCLHLQARRIFWLLPCFGEKLVGLFVKERVAKFLKTIIFKYLLSIFFSFLLFFQQLLIHNHRLWRNWLQILSSDKKSMSETRKSGGRRTMSLQGKCLQH